MSDVADITSIVTAAATCVALGFAGYELRRSRARDLRKHRVEIEGVAVSWEPVEAPRAAEADQGMACWKYRITAWNPGPLPISDVRVVIKFKVDFQRIRHDGHYEDPVRDLELVTPVIAGGGGQRTWDRRLWMSYATAHELLPQTEGVISFVDPDDAGRRQENRWPKRFPAVDPHAAVSPAAARPIAGRPAEGSVPG